jgi:hypothetical protein
MDFGDLTGASRVLLVIRGATDWSSEDGNDRFIRVKDAGGNWVDAYSQSQLSTLDGTPRNQVVDMTGKFLTADHRIRVGFNSARMNYFAVDTSEAVPVTVTTVHPTSADLGFRGFTEIDKTYFWDHDYESVSSSPPEPFADQIGNFTKFGDVAPLLAATDDQFVIMHYGDHMDVTFPGIPLEEGMERSFVLYNWVTYKHANKDTGQTVDPLPFFGMEEYPTDGYPMTEENAAYLAEWNTRVVEGVIGSGSTIIDSSSTADVVATSEYAGGLVGYNGQDRPIINSYATGTVSGNRRVGGLVGYNDGFITRSYAEGAVTGSDDDLGGLAGTNDGSGRIEDSYATGVVDGDSSFTDRVGGLVGQNSGGDILRSYATGDVDGYSKVGGLTGANGGSIRDSYARGAVTGDNNVGGLSGRSGGSIVYSFSTGAVTGLNTTGGLLGEQPCCGSTSNSFWDTETSLQLSSAAGTGETTANMKTASTFTDQSWDFDTVWFMSGGSNDGYPDLRAINGAGLLPDADEDGRLDIASCEDLIAINNDLTATYELIDDIDCTMTNPDDESFDTEGPWADGFGFDPIGDGDEDWFMGLLYGDDHVINGLFIARDFDDYVGLFAIIGGGQVYDLGIVDADITGNYYTGALAGKLGGGATRTYSTGSVSGYSYVGGLVGTHESAGSGCCTIIDSYSTATVTGEYEYVGGLVGYNDDNKLITGSYATGAVTGDFSVGGLVGRNDSSAEITMSYATGAVEGNERVGGLVGQNSGGIITRSYAVGNVTGVSRVGGLTGANGGTITNAYARGQVFGEDDVASFSGRCGEPITNGYGTGPVSATGEEPGDVGGFLGYDDGCDVSTSFWDTTTTKQVMSATEGETGLATAAMKLMSTYADASWDFDNIWAIDSEVNGGYPYLQGVDVVLPAPYPSTGGGGGSSGGGGASIPAALTVVSPNGGETLTAGSTHSIQWTSEGGQQISVAITLSTDGGLTYPTIVDADDPNDGFFDWTVPNIATSSVRIRVLSKDILGNEQAADASNADFAIAGTTGNGGGGGGGGSTPPSTPGSGSSGGGETNAGDAGASGGGSNPDTEGAGSSASGPDSMPRDEANAALPSGYPVDALVKLPSDNDPTTEHDTTVYYIGLDAKRHSFPTVAMYHSWYADFGQVIEIDAATLASIPLGDPILVRPGTKWVKLETDPKTYYVAPGYRLRHIEDEAAAAALWGPLWNTNILDVSDALFANFTMGNPISAAGLDTGWPSGSLIEEENGDRWYLTVTERRKFESGAAFLANLFQEVFLRRDPEKQGWSMKTVGAPILGHEDALTSLMH